MANTVKERITQLTSEDSRPLTEKFKGEIVYTIEIHDDEMVITFESGRSVSIWGDYDGYINLEASGSD